MRIARQYKHFALVLILLTAAPAAGLTAEPCLLVYTHGQTLFKYDSARYSELSSSSVEFDPAYSMGGIMLWDNGESRVAHEAYQAPGLVAFQPSLTGRNEFTTTASIARLVVDGFTRAPTQFSDIIVQFAPVPTNARPDIYVDGLPVSGLRHVVPWIQISTLQDGGFYSDAVEFEVRWSGAESVDVIAYADRNGNRILDGPACFVAVLLDETVKTRERTWGGIKALFE